MSENATADPLVGRLLDGRYQIRSRIARGGMATVYLATDLRLERRVAVKVMHGHLADDAAFRERFIREARSAARLAHPNVVAVFDQGEDRDMAYLVMEYLPGITLRELLQEHRVLTTEQTFDIMEAVLSGLAAAHKAGIVHRDLKPENVMLADDGRIKIGDFGLARAVSANTATGAALLGTIAYLSPELVTRGTADARSDIYAIGIMMYEMLTGEQPFKGEQPVQIAYQHANGSVPAPSDRNPRVPAELDELVLWATARKPEDRPADARALLDQLFETHSALMTALPGTGTDTGHRTAVFPGIGRIPTGETTVYNPGLAAETGETTVLGGRGRQHTSETAPVSDRTAALALRTSKRKRRGWVWLTLVIVLALLGGGAGWWFGVGPGAQAQVPTTLQGLSVEAATAALQAADLRVAGQREDFSLTVPQGSVIDTDPPMGTTLMKGESVTLIVSAGPQILSVPGVAGMPLGDALTALAAFAVDADASIRQYDAAAADTVLAALGPDGAPLAEGAQLAEGSPITLVVSAGPIGAVDAQSPAQVTDYLESIGLHVGSTSEEFSTEIPAGYVIRYVPRAEPIHPGDTVDLVVSKGEELFAIPDVVGMNRDQAKKKLADAGFVAVYSSFWDGAPNGLTRVKEMSPAAGEQKPKGTKINLVITADG